MKTALIVVIYLMFYIYIYIYIIYIYIYIYIYICMYVIMCGGGGGRRDKLFTCPYPLKFQAKPWNQTRLPSLGFWGTRVEKGANDILKKLLSWHVRVEFWKRFKKVKGVKLFTKTPRLIGFWTRVWKVLSPTVSP